MEKHAEEDLYIYGYTSGPFASKNLIWNSTTRMMRGLIVNKQGKVISKSFDKFFTFKKYLSPNTIQLSDGQVASIPNCPFKIYEKLDGSLSVLYWINETPFLASQRSFSSLKALRANSILHNKYSHLFSKLKKDRTYIFEAIYPETKVLIDYTFEEDLILLGIIDNQTGKDLPLEDIGFPLAKDWTEELSYLTNLEDIQSLNLENKEGFVIVYDNGFRIKIKFPWYSEAHNIMNQIIQYEYLIDFYEKKLKNIKGFPINKFNSDKLVERFKNNEKPNEILQDFPNIFKYIGINSFVENEFIKYKSQSDIFPKINLNLEKLIFQNDKFYFDSRSENIMWNRWNNLMKKYDW